MFITDMVITDMVITDMVITDMVITEVLTRTASPLSWMICWRPGLIW